jgi:hypothetical protein
MEMGSDLNINPSGLQLEDSVHKRTIRGCCVAKRPTEAEVHQVEGPVVRERQRARGRVTNSE